MAVAAPLRAEILVRLVGPFEVLRDGAPVGAAELGSRKARLLVKLLAAERARVVTVDRVVEVLWAGEAGPRRPAENVATLVSRLRRVLGPSWVEGGRDGYRLARPPDVTVDLDEAQGWVSEAERRDSAGEPGLALAAASRAIDLLGAGQALEDEPDADWSQPVRAQLISLLRKGRHVLAQAALDAGDPRLAESAAQAALAADPYDEPACRLLMRALQALGEPARALVAFAALQDLLAADLGADPAPETRDLHLALLRDAPTTRVRPSGNDAETLGLVGRGEELRRLRSAWNDAAAGAGSLVLVVGEAGIGKTRLCEELVAIASTTGGTVLRARCHEAERSLFLQPVVDAVDGAFRTLPPELTRSAADDAAEVLAGLVPAAAALLGPAGPHSGRTSAQLERRRAFEAVDGFVRRLSVPGPVLLYLDDLHTAGRATVELLHYLSRHAPTRRVLLVATVRAEEGVELLDLLAGVGSRLDLATLPPAAVARLAAAAGRPELAEPIQRRTGGHALFVVETLRALAAGEEGVPRSLQDTVLARVRRAGAGVEEVLRAGSVLGSSYDPAVVATMLGTPMSAVVTRSEEGLGARLLVPRGREYEFANDLVREVLYATTSVPARLAFHHQAADLLTDRPEAVAGHAVAAEDWPRAARALLRAGEQALSRYAAADAEELLGRSLEAAARSGDLDVRARALLARAHARVARAGYQDALADLELAVQVSRDTGDQRLEMRALRALGGEAQIALGRPVEEMTGHLQHALRLATSLGDRAMEADLLAWMAILASNALRFDEAVRHGRRAVDAARASGDVVALVAALDGRKTPLAYLGEIDELEPVLTELLPLLRRVGDTFRLHWTIFESGFPAVAAGDWATAAARFQLALDSCRSSGLSAYAPWHVAHLGWLARLQGRDDEALELGRLAVTLNEELPHAWCGATAAALLGGTLIETGQREAAVPVLERGCGLAGQHGSEAYLLRCLAPLAEATGSHEVLAEADAMLSRVGTPPGSAWMGGDFTYLSVARAWLSAGEPARARAVLAPMLVVAQRVPWVAALAQGSLVDAVAASRLGLDDEARSLMQVAADLARRFGLARVEQEATAGPA